MPEEAKETLVERAHEDALEHRERIISILDQQGIKHGDVVDIRRQDNYTTSGVMFAEVEENALIYRAINGDRCGILFDDIIAVEMVEKSVS